LSANAVQAVHLTRRESRGAGGGPLRRLPPGTALPVRRRGSGTPIWPKRFEAYRAGPHRRRNRAVTLQRELRELLLRVMCRTERPALGQDGMLREHIRPARRPWWPRDLRSYVAMRQIAKKVDAPMSVEYWKSAPVLPQLRGRGTSSATRSRPALKDETHPELPGLLDGRTAPRCRGPSPGNSRSNTATARPAQPRSGHTRSRLVEAAVAAAVDAVPPPRRTVRPPRPGTASPSG